MSSNKSNKEKTKSSTRSSTEPGSSAQRRTAPEERGSTPSTTTSRTAAIASSGASPLNPNAPQYHPAQAAPRSRSAARRATAIPLRPAPSRIPTAIWSPQQGQQAAGTLPNASSRAERRPDTTATSNAKSVELPESKEGGVLQSRFQTARPETGQNVALLDNENNNGFQPTTSVSAHESNATGTPRRSQKAYGSLAIRPQREDSNPSNLRAAANEFNPPNVDIPPVKLAGAVPLALQQSGAFDEEGYARDQTIANELKWLDIQEEMIRSQAPQTPSHQTGPQAAPPSYSTPLRQPLNLDVISPNYSSDPWDNPHGKFNHKKWQQERHEAYERQANAALAKAKAKENAAAREAAAAASDMSTAPQTPATSTNPPSATPATPSHPRAAAPVTPTHRPQPTDHRQRATLSSHARQLSSPRQQPGPSPPGFQTHVYNNMMAHAGANNPGQTIPQLPPVATYGAPPPPDFWRRPTHATPPASFMPMTSPPPHISSPGGSMNPYLPQPPPPPGFGNSLPSISPYSGIGYAAGPQPHRMGNFVFVSNITPDVTTEILRLYFGYRGTVLYVWLPSSSLNIRRRNAIVQYARPEEATAAIRNLHLTFLGGRTIQVRQALEHELMNFE